MDSSEHLSNKIRSVKWAFSWSVASVSIEAALELRYMEQLESLVGDAGL
jgi:hypothetical protein